MATPELIDWELDWQTRCNPELLTRLLRKAVPVLEYLGITVEETRPGYARVNLPLTLHGSNQHGVHQAAVLAIAADYAGGIALGTVIPGASIIGVHPQADHNGASLWAVSLKIDYKLPSSSHVSVIATVPEDSHERIKARYFNGRMVLETVDITLTGDGELFASSSITYFIRQAESLKPQSPNAAPNAMFSHKRKASARLIAGLRAMEASNSEPLFEDSYSRIAAGEHGHLLAERFLAESPQLRDMVANRTRDIDNLVLDHPNLHQVVSIGAGLDLRPFRLSKRLSGIPVFEVDLPQMLSERERILSQIGELPSIRRVPVACNLELQSLGQELIAAGFDPTQPTIFILEGVSMYLEEKINDALFEEIASLMKCEESRLWVDIVDLEILGGFTPHPEVGKFLNGMANLGEPFIWGISRDSNYFARFGLEVDRSVASDCYRPSSDPVFSLYHFYSIRHLDIGHRSWDERNLDLKMRVDISGPVVCR